MAKAKLSPEIRQIRDRCVVEPDEFEAWLAERGMSWKGLDSGAYGEGVNLETAQFAFICQDPVLWCRAFMDDPDAHDQPWEFFDYQEESVRAWDQDAIHRDAAEVGKTREIVALVCWGACTGFGGRIWRPWILVGAPQTTHLDEIIMAVEYHFGVSDEHDGRPPLIHDFWRKPKRTPHTMHRFVGAMGPARVYYRPAGHDGEAFRGVHVNAMALMDEAAKIKHAVSWSEFFRAMKPGCIFRGYSVPDGDNTTEFYKMDQKAVEDLPKGQPGMRLFHWPKTIMPDPFWNEKRKEEFINRYGSTDAPGYVRNVLGEHGQAENPVFPWHQINRNIHDVPEYVCLKLIADQDRDELSIEAYRVELTVRDKTKSPQNRWLYHGERDLDDYNDSKLWRDAFYELLREFIEPAAQGVYWYGADLGFSNDPSEIFLMKEVGHELRDQVRIQMRGVGYDQQAEVIYCLDKLNNFQGEWGCDFGNAGTAVVQNLQRQEAYADGNYEDRLTGFQFAAAMDAIDEYGDPVMEENKKGDMEAVRKPAKEVATDLITWRLQRRGFAWAFDQEVIGHFTNHTAREGARNRIFDKTDDHTIDAKRVLMLRKAMSASLGGAPDVFASGVKERVA